MDYQCFFCLEYEQKKVNERSLIKYFTYFCSGNKSKLKIRL